MGVAAGGLGVAAGGLGVAAGVLGVATGVFDGGLGLSFIFGLTAVAMACAVTLPEGGDGVAPLPPMLMSAQFQNSSGGPPVPPQLPRGSLGPRGSPGGTQLLPVSQYHCSTHRLQLTPAGSLASMTYWLFEGAWSSAPEGKKNGEPVLGSVSGCSSKHACVRDRAGSLHSLNSKRPLCHANMATLILIVAPGA